MFTLANLSPIATGLLVALLITLSLLLIVVYCYIRLRIQHKAQKLDFDSVSLELKNRKDRIFVQSKIISAYVNKQRRMNDLTAQIFMLLDLERLQELLKIVNDIQTSDVSEQRNITEIRQCLQKAIKTYQ